MAAQLVADKIIHLSHHCRTEASLHIKSELLVLGALAILSGSVNGFRKLPLVTHICATEHSKFFLKFVKYLFDKRADYIYLPRDDLELRAVMKRYEEMGIPGAMGSVDVVHVKWSNSPLEISIVLRANNPILPLPLNAFPILIVEFVTCMVLNSEQEMISTL